MSAHTSSSYLARRPMVLGVAKVLFLTLGQLPIAQAAPLFMRHIFSAADEKEGKDPGDPSLWVYLSVAAFLVLLGGAFAGLTIALMGQDEIYLQVIKDSGEGKERTHATKVLNLLRRGKHWVLVTLLLGNVITNETLPIVLDRSLGGGWPAVLGSTVLIVIFGEIAPQSICVRYGLPIGSFMAPFVVALMWLLAPVAWPTAKLLDYLLGEDHGTTYKKAGLKTLVGLHRSLGDATQQLNSDEVTIISAVLDLKEKAIGSIMTPMDDVFTLSLDDVLDEPTMDEVLSQGYSRIPIHHPDNDSNFVGMLLVKMLITYDPEDAKPVRDFALATLPETQPDTSCLDIVNFFQEGKSHMVLVSEYPGEDHGALGVVTLEDVIEELIGEEIVDESDVFIDVHRAIKRSIAAPIRRLPKTYILPDDSSTINGGVPDLIDIAESEILSPEDLQRAKTTDNVPKKTKEAGGNRRRSSANSVTPETKPVRRGASNDEIKEHLKHLGPSNLASRPRTTRYNTVKIKPGTSATKSEDRIAPIRRISENVTEHQSGIGEGLLTSAGKNASGGVQALKQGYGSMSSSPDDERPRSANKAGETQPPQKQENSHAEISLEDNDQSRPLAKTMCSQSTIGSLPDSRPQSRSPYYQHKGPARSGSITENIVDTNGFRKVVLEMSSSSESNEDEDNSGANKGNHQHDARKSSSSLKLRGGEEIILAEPHDEAATKKKRRKRKHARKGEREPLLSGN